MNLRIDLREEFIVCYAAAYPDPFWPTPNTLENASRFAREHRQADGSHAVVKRRFVTDWQRVALYPARATEQASA